jgi:hypothetical protein
MTIHDQRIVPRDDTSPLPAGRPCTTIHHPHPSPFFLALGRTRCACSQVSVTTFLESWGRESGTQGHHGEDAE